MDEARILSGRYQLEGSLGSGGMASVYRARDLMLERTVAIKLLRSDLSTDEQFREQFRQEAKSVANLSHPNIVMVHDFGFDGEQLFIVMENVPGMDLKAFLHARGRLTVQEALKLISQACAGLGYAHRAGLVHCDVKPQNMLVTPDNHLKVVDFGIARALASISLDEGAEVVWGSPYYFAPEQAGGEPLSPASDVYSLGVVTYELLTGQLPFNATTAEELARMHLEVAPLQPRTLNPSIPPQLEQIILRAMAKQPERRYYTADQLGRDLNSFSLRAPLAESFYAAGHTVQSLPAEPDYAEASMIWPSAMGDEAEYQDKLNVQQPGPNVRPASYARRRNGKPDISTWFLALLALLAVGGLVPFLIWVYRSLAPYMQ